MKVELTQEEANQLVAAINIAIKASDDAIRTSMALNPLVVKISQAFEPESK